MIRIKQRAYAGTLESSDAFVQVLPLDDEGVEIELESTVEEIYGDAIRQYIKDVVSKMKMCGVKLLIQDKGALDFVIEARVQTALFRAAGTKSLDWSTL